MDGGRRQIGTAIVIAAVAACGVLVGGWLPLFSAPGEQVVLPEDVATPTPTYEVILVPTATPSPMSAVPGAGETEDAGTYVVRQGDTIWRIALEVGLDLEVMPCSVAPAFRSDMPLVIGDTLHLLPPGWRCHEVLNGETVNSVAAAYGVAPQQLLNVSWNELGGPGEELPVGSFLRVPPGSVDYREPSGFLTYMLGQSIEMSPMLAYAAGGPRQASTRNVAGPLPKNWPYGSGTFLWPVFGWLSQPYRDDHRAIDIAASVGAFVTAADRGVVVRAGWNDQGYGLFVVIDHNIDYVTLYSHLDEIFVSEGEVVSQGQILGTVGNTGNSTGPHLHFEIRDFGSRTNPLGLLTR